jgi:hypothetical protein
MFHSVFTVNTLSCSHLEGMRALLVVTVLACVAAIAFIAAVENQPDAGQRELVASSWPAKHQGFYYWSDSTAKQGEVGECEQAGGAGGWRHARRRFHMVHVMPCA